MSRIFISHSSADNAAALAVARWLEEEGWNDFFLDVSASRGLAPGERWQDALKSAADRCEAVLFLISPAWRESRWCLAEFLLAKQLGKTIFGTLVEPTPLDSLPIEMTADWQLCNLVDGATRRDFRVVADPIVSATTVSFSQAGLDALRVGLQRAGLDPSSFPWPPIGDPGRLPYRGLRALEAEDAAVFFGREGAIVRGLDCLRGLRERGVERMLVVLGASGAGKSSFLRAGLWPRLRRDDRHFLPLPVIRPEGAAISGASGLVSSLDAAFREQRHPRTRAQIREALDEHGLAHLLAELQGLASTSLGTSALPPTVLLAIDQGEELYVGEAALEAERLLGMVGDIFKSAADHAPDPGPSTLIIVAIRSDSYPRLQQDRRLACVKAALFDLRPLTPGEFRAVIEGPAARATASGQKLVVDPKLTERLLNDIDGPDALPLLAFALERLLVEHGGTGELRLEDYEALDGLRGAMGAALEAAFAQPGRAPVIPAEPAERYRLLRQGFIPWLATIDPHTEERKRRVARWENIPVAARPLLERLINQRLLTSDRRRLADGEEDSIVVEVAHEALLRQWPAVTAWLDEDADALKSVETAKRAAAEWISHGRDIAWLTHSGERLAGTEKWLQRSDLAQLMGPQVLAYLSACRTREDEQRRDRERQLERTAVAQRRTAVVLALSGVVGLLAAIWITTQTRAVARQTSLVLSTAAEEAANAGIYDRALRFAVLAARETWLRPAHLGAEPQLARAAHASRLRAQFRGHHSAVNSAVLSGDSLRVATASDDGTVRVWNANNGEELNVLEHDTAVTAVALTQDGERAITLSGRTVRVWDLSTSRELSARSRFGDHFSPALSTDGRRVVAVAPEDATPKVWDVESGKELAVLRQAEIDRFLFSKDGRRLVGVSHALGDEKKDDGELLVSTTRILQADSGEELAVLHHDGYIRLAELSGDGRRVVTVSEDTTALRKDRPSAQVWDADSGKQLSVVRDDRLIEFAVLSNDGRRLLTVSEDTGAGLPDGRPRARVWDAESGEELSVLWHERAITSAEFSSDGRQVVTASGNRAWVWEVESGAELTMLWHEGDIGSATFSREGRHVITASSDGTARVWDVESEMKLGALRHEALVDEATFSSDGRRVVTASKDATARVWDTDSGREVSVLRHDGAVESAAFDDDGRRILTVSGNIAQIWDTESGKTLRVLRHSDVVKSAVFGAQGQLVATASSDSFARVWDAESGEQLQAFHHPDRVFGAVMTSDGRRIATVDKGRDAHVWDVGSGSEAYVLGHDRIVDSVNFSLDGSLILTASEDGTARLWAAENGKLLRALPHDGRVFSAAFIGDGRRVMTVSESLSAEVWDTESGEQLSKLEHEDSVSSAATRGDGRFVATASGDAVRIWDAESGKELAILPHGAYVSSVAFSKSGRRAVTACGSEALVWNTDWFGRRSAQELIELACKERLTGAQYLTVGDTKAVPLLAKRMGEDVCALPSSLSFPGTWAEVLQFFQ